MARNANTTPGSLAARSPTPELAHDNYGPQFNAAVWILTGMAGVFLGLRLYCKHIRRKHLWWDDYVLVASFVCLIAQTSMLSVCVHFGFGKHSRDITDWYSYLLVANITGVLSITAAAWSKTSFAITLLRFTNGWMRWLVWFVIFSVNIFLGLSGLFTYVQCWPISQLWDDSVPGTCWPQNVIVYYNSFSSSYSGAMDILLAILPWWIINTRSLGTRERLGVSVAMSMGVFAGITSIAKTATLWAISDPDTIHSVSLMILATAETAITITAASIPVLRALIKDKRSVRTAPPFYHEYQSQDPHPSHIGSNHELIGSPSPVLTKPRKDDQFMPELTNLSSNPRKMYAGGQGNTWLSSASGSEVAMHDENGKGV